MIFKRFALLSIGIIASALTAEAQQKPYIQSLDEPNVWVDSVFNKMSRRQKIAQLFFVRAHTNKGAAYSDSVGKVIRKERIGGVVFFQGGPGRQAGRTQQPLPKIIKSTFIGCIRWRVGPGYATG